MEPRTATNPPPCGCGAASRDGEIRVGPVARGRPALARRSRATVQGPHSKRAQHAGEDLEAQVLLVAEPYARRCVTRTLLLRPSTKPTATLWPSPRPCN